MTPEGPSVMIVEDDRDTREMLARFLALEGFSVRQAENGAQALDALNTGGACVILLDLMMPVMNGWQFRAAQSSDPRLSGIPVVVVTAAGAAEKLPGIAANAWIPKPVDFDRLLSVITPFCDGAAC
ncbi:MAG TPA: response regulator [Vicinamibacterales bacterium]